MYTPYTYTCVVIDLMQSFEPGGLTKAKSFPFVASIFFRETREREV